MRKEQDPVWTPEPQCVSLEVWFEQPCSPLSSACGQHSPGPVNIRACFPLYGQCVGSLVFQHNPLETPVGGMPLAINRVWRGGTLAWRAPSLAVPSRDPALKLHFCLIGVSGNERGTASCCREGENMHAPTRALEICQNWAC